MKTSDKNKRNNFYNHGVYYLTKKNVEELRTKYFLRSHKLDNIHELHKVRR